MLTLDPTLALGLENAFRQLGVQLGREILPVAGDFLRQPGMRQSPIVADLVPVER